ncbi:MAG: hypothetical protein PHD95_03475 [Candidatus ainarchaeum sp.]|nr:hypothetical protein [Candidatus ainarchaeum sp.]
MRRHETRAKRMHEADKKRQHDEKLRERGRLSGVGASAANRMPIQGVSLKCIGPGYIPTIGPDTFKLLCNGHNATSGKWMFILDNVGQAKQVFSFTIVSDPFNESTGRKTIGRFTVDLEKRTIRRQ